MNFILEHLEYLIRRHDCVIVPGLGAVIVRYRAARFDSRHPLVLLPPSRELAFNSELSESDGLLEKSVARRSGVSFEAARRKVAQEVESMVQQLRTLGSLSLGRLGELAYTEYGSIVFDPAPAAGWDFRFYGLRPLYLQNAEAVISQSAVASVSSSIDADSVSESADSHAVMSQPIARWEDDEPAEEPRGGFTRAVVGIAASLAVIISVALFFINPIKVDNEPLMASMAPVEGTVEEDAEVGIKMEVASEESIAVTADDERYDETVDCGAGSKAGITAVNHDGDKAFVRPTSVDTAEKAPVDNNDDSKSRKAANAGNPVNKVRFSEVDPFCVIVASFPDADQAQRYMAENPGRLYGVLQQDGKFRVYAATGASYEEASAQKSSVGGEGVWICRR